MKILFDVEAQKSFYPGYPIVTRGIVYGARMISNQVDTEFVIPNYTGLKKVYSIWICFDAPKYIGNAITKYSIAKEDILGSIPIEKEAYDKMTIVQICLREDLNDHKDQMIRLLNTIFSEEKTAKEIGNVLEKEYNIPMESRLKREIVGMCNLGERIEERATQRGMQKGIEQGIEQGIKQMITNALQNHSPIDVSSFLNIPIEQVQAIADKL